MTLEAIANEQLLYGLASTVHRQYYKALSTVYASVEEVGQSIRQLLQEPDVYPRALKAQNEALKLADRAEIMAFFNQLEGGQR